MKFWLLEEFAEFPAACRLVSTTPPEDILERPVLDRPPIDKWAFGRVLLIGDAVGINAHVVAAYLSNAFAYIAIANL